MVSGALFCLLLAAKGETPLTLQEALAHAEQANPELLAARERAAAQALRGESAERLRWPRLALRSGWSRTDQPSWVFAHKLDAGEFAATFLSRMAVPVVYYLIARRGRAEAIRQAGLAPALSN